ncbi:ABC transporter ATP-binding protein [Pseudonocardia hispaniensis]|uniref:ABC transporter ATP-binding protein n=1 Tax=Pseudonocardia hispaniensis TaxID=904933 RepID=A0ABW1J640_9PSEU
MSLLTARDLTVDFGGRAVLHGVDLDVAPGEALVVLGGSGSGKSTLLRALLGLVPAPGRVRAGTLALHTGGGWVDLTRRGAWRRVRGREIGMVFQDPALALTPLRRVGSLVAEAASEPNRVEPLLAAGGLADPGRVAARRACELSGGQAQRVGLVLAVAGGPRMLLADEPTTALDGPARDALVGRLRERADAGTAVVLVTHDVSVAAAFADRIIVLDGGRVVEQGPPTGVLGDPGHAATRALVRDVPWSLPARTRPVPRPARPPVVRVRGLAKAFAGTGPVLAGLDLDVADGEVVGIIGRSGEGKTTLLRCLLGLQRPDAGDLLLGGVDPAAAGWAAVRRAVSLVPQDPRASLNPWRTAAQLVADPLDFHRIGDRAFRRKRARDLLAAVGLGEMADRRPNALSTGQCQRVSIARALAVRPRLLVADEPASALDVTLQAEVITLLSRVVAEHGMSALVVSHDLHVLERLCDRIAVLDDGRLVEDLPVDRLRADATHPRTRALLAAYPTDPLAVAAG